MSKFLKMTLCALCISFCSCEKIYKGLGAGTLIEFTGSYILVEKYVTNVGNTTVIPSDTIILDIGPFNARLLSLSFQKTDGSNKIYTSRRSEYNLYENGLGNNTIEAYIPSENKYIYLEDLSKDQKEKIMISNFVDKINGESDTVRYIYQKYTGLLPAYK